MARSKVTSDFIVDRLEQWWQEVRLRFLSVKTLVINLDNGPENHSRRTQFLKRIVEFARKYGLAVQLAYYPPYHSKYNPIERCWGILEMHWNGSLLDSIEAVVGFAGSMTWKGKHPVVSVVETAYAKGVRLKPKEMKALESEVVRLAGLGKWFVKIPGRGAGRLASFKSLRGTVLEPPPFGHSATGDRGDISDDRALARDHPTRIGRAAQAHSPWPRPRRRSRPSAVRTRTPLRCREGRRRGRGGSRVALIAASLARVERDGEDRGQEADHTHRPAARGAAKPRRGGGLGRGMARQPIDQPGVQRHQPAHGLDRLPAVGAQEAVVPHLLEAAGQDVLEKPADELEGIDGHLPPAVRAAAAIREGHAAVRRRRRSGGR